jgi:hypothetical protein
LKFWVVGHGRINTVEIFVEYAGDTIAFGAGGYPNGLEERMVFCEEMVDLFIVLEREGFERRKGWRMGGVGEGSLYKLCVLLVWSE